MSADDSSAVTRSRERLKTFGLLVWRYAAVGALLATSAWVVIAYLVAGDRPTPLTPPDGHVAEESRVQLTWSDVGPERSHRIVVAKGEDFSKPVFDKKVRGASVYLPRLRPGERYCWKVAGSGTRISCFRTGQHAIRY